MVYGKSQMSNDSMTFFVSPDGNDSWSGLLKTPAADGRDGPLASLQGARDAIRKAKHAGDIHGPIEISVYGVKLFLLKKLT